MVFICFFGVKTLRQACIIVAVIYAIIAVINLIGSLIGIARDGHWIYTLTLLEAVSSLPFHGLLYVGAQKERAPWVRMWLGYTLLATLPVVVIYLGVGIYYVYFYRIISSIVELVLRGWMWCQAREFYYQLINQGSTSENPTTPQQNQYGPPPPYTTNVI